MKRVLHEILFYVFIISLLIGMMTIPRCYNEAAVDAREKYEELNK